MKFETNGASLGGNWLPLSEFQISPPIPPWGGSVPPWGGFWTNGPISMKFGRNGPYVAALYIQHSIAKTYFA